MAYLRTRLNYDPETGHFTWRLAYHKRHVGKRAGGVDRYKDGQQRWRINIDGVKFLGSRLAWAFMTGEWPEFEIDHKDGNPLNDVWENLRPSTRQQNCANTGLRSDSSSGIKGVHRRENGTYLAHVTKCGRTYTKTFKELEAASEWAAHVREELHGEYARHE